MEQNKYEIIYTEKFKKEIEKVFLYIANELKNNIAAENLIQLIENGIIKRSQNPESYKSFKLKDNGKFVWYRININNFSAFYTVEKNKMVMRRFLYAKRNIKKL